MSLKTQRTSLIVASAALVGLLSYIVFAGANAQADSWIKDPERTTERVLPLPLLIAPDVESYTPLVSGEGLMSAAQVGVPVAYIPNLPAELRESVSVKLLSAQDLQHERTSAQEGVAFTMLSNVRYTGSGHVVAVSVSQASAAARQRPTIAGNETVQLADGTHAWLRSSQVNEYSNAVVFLQDDFIISIASDLSADEVIELAGKVVVETK